MTTIAFSDFVRRQTKDSPFSYTELDDATVISRTLANLGAAKPGYKDGVLLVSVEARGFFSATCVLKEGDKLAGSYCARRPGEQPRKQVGVVGGQKAPAKAVQIVLYSHAVLAEDQDAHTDADWEIVSINATVVPGDEPMTVGTLLANHFHVEGSNDGGTSTGMTDSELVEALRVSYFYGRDKANVAPAE